MAKHDAIDDEALRERLATAHGHLRGGRPTDAVHTIVEAFLAMLDDHPELLTRTAVVRGREMPVVLRWPNLGADLVPGSLREGKARIETTRDRFAISEAITYYEFCVDTALDAEL